MYWAKAIRWRLRAPRISWYKTCAAPFVMFEYAANRGLSMR